MPISGVMSINAVAGLARAAPMLLLASLIAALPGIATAETWGDYAYAQDGFAVSAPTKPQFSSGVTPGLNGDPDIDTRVYAIADGDNYYSVTVSRLRRPLRDLALALRNAERSFATHGQITDRRSISQGGISGFALEVILPPASNKSPEGILMKVRYFATASMAWAIVAGWPKGKPPADYQRFLDSFRFVTR